MYWFSEHATFGLVLTAEAAHYRGMAGKRFGSGHAKAACAKGEHPTLVFVKPLRCDRLPCSGPQEAHCAKVRFDNFYVTCLIVKHLEMTFFGNRETKISSSLIVRDLSSVNGTAQ
jgi:hypothetical protein